jgi:hypothetical protein
MSKPWRSITKITAAGLVAAWKPIVGAVTDETASPKPWYDQAVVSLQYKVPIALAVAIVVLEIWDLWNKYSNKSQLKSFLNHLHEKYFPYPTGGRDPDFRVTFFAPRRRWRRKTLRVMVRSGTMLQTSKVGWDIGESEAGRYHGIAGYCWATGIFYKEMDLPDYDNSPPDQQKLYRDRTFASEGDIAKLHWHARSYCSLIVKDRAGERLGVLMMESKLPDGLNNMNADKLKPDAEYLQYQMG